MIRTDYTRQVPIRHWLPSLKDDSGVYLDGDCPQFVITGYKVQRAWHIEYVPDEYLPIRISQETEKALMRGEEVEGFQWIDLPIVPQS